MSGNTPTYKIVVLQSVPLESPILTDNHLITSNNQTITLPSTTSTLATVAQVGLQEERIDRLVAYLARWISAGNLSMEDIAEAVDPPASP